MKSHIKICITTLLLFGACKTHKPVVQNSVSQAPVTIIQPKADTIVNNSPPPRNYSVPKKIFKELENYETAFDELKAMLEGTQEPNFERAVFISENPYYNNLNKYADFQQNIDFHIYFIKALIKDNDKSDSIDFNVKVNQYGRFNLDDIRHMPDEKKALYKKSIANWAIFKYLTDTVYSIIPKDDLFTDVICHSPFTYSSHDPFGKKKWSTSQVINLLYSQEQKGNCFALTAFFKILSDRLQSDARICTAPQHIYIQHRDKKGDYYNVELATAGHPGDGTIQTLTHTTTEAIKSGIALRSFDAKQSMGLCLVNLAKSYEHKFGSKDDDFLLRCAELVLKHDPLNLNALLLKQQILDVRVTNFALENNISDINKLKANKEISATVTDLENHLALLYRLGYRQMPYDMQEIIMTGIYPKDFKDKNPSPFTTIDPKDEHRKKFTTLYGGLFQEVFETREFEPYGHFTFQTTTNKITVVDTTAQTGFLIDPVAFAYDFGARMYDARLGRFTSVDPHAHSYPHWSPYSAFANNPIVFIDPDGRDIKPSKAFLASSYGALYQDLYKNNSAYLKIVNKYNTSKVFNLTLNYGDKGVPAGFNAWTTTNWQYLLSNPKKITGANSNQAYAQTPLIRTVEQESDDKTTVFTYERTDLGKVRTIIHEGLHSYLGARGISEGDEHNTFNTYRSMMLEALTEYNTDNKLGYTADQLNEFSYLGTQSSKQFKSYIQGLADKNGTDYDTELSGFNKRTSEMEWKQTKKEEKSKE